LLPILGKKKGRQGEEQKKEKEEEGKTSPQPPYLIPSAQASRQVAAQIRRRYPHTVIPGAVEASTPGNNG
jgi:hypothetical protein